VLRDVLAQIAWPCRGTVRIEAAVDGTSTLTLCLPALERWWPDVALRADLDATRLVAQTRTPAEPGDVAAAWALCLFGTCFAALPSEAALTVTVDLDATAPSGWRVSAEGWAVLLPNAARTERPAQLLASHALGEPLERLPAARADG
jgi:hypothetical protein